MLKVGDFLDLGRKQAELFVANNVAYSEVLVTCYCPRQILLYAYESLLKQRKITPIEDLLQEDKEYAWKQAKEIAKGRLGNKALKEIVKAFVVINYFLNL